MKVVAFSDFHMLARRSRGPELLPSILERTKKSDKLVICGDLFDFRWSEAKTLELAFEKALAVLQQILDATGTCEIHYILGNHDSNAEFLPHLDELQAREERFSWSADYLLLGNTLFLHGDIPMKNGGKALSPRTKFKEHEKIWGTAMNVMYDFITFTRLVNLYRKCVDANRKLPSILQAVERNTAFSEVTHIIFGHSHHHFTKKQIGRFTVTNLGSGVIGYKANVQELEIAL